MQSLRKILFIEVIIFADIFGQNFLSNLSAAREDPVYTTYAAAAERSSYIIDEGYQFSWFNDNDGVNFETDNGGSICLAFKRGNEVKYFLRDFSQQPVIRTSYSDLVKYSFYPFDNILATVFFVVYSSGIAIQDIKIVNEGDSVVSLSVYPFFFNKTGSINNVFLTPESDAFIFRHQEPPDSWTIEHNIPYEEDLSDVYLIDSSPDSYGAYSDLQGGYNFKHRTPSTNYCVEWGTVTHSDGTPCLHTPPSAQQVILHNGNEDEILTEDAPKWGDPDPNIPGNGYQGCELGNFQNPPAAVGDSFKVIFTCIASNEQGISSNVIQNLPAPMGVRTDIQLADSSFPPLPQNFHVNFSSGNTSAVITWTPTSGYLYNIYRRTASSPGRYDLLEADINGNAYLDQNLDPDSTYGYVVLSKDASGNLSGHTIEQGNIHHSSSYFLSDIENQSLSDEIPPGSIKVAAFQKNLVIGPGQSSGIRIIRGTAADTSDISILISSCRDLKLTDLQKFINADETAYSNIPEFNPGNADYRMLYWNCFNLLKQCMMPPEGECSYNYYVFSREPQWGWGHGGQVFHESLSMLAYAFMNSASAMNSQRVYIERQQANGYINYRTGPYLNETIPYNGQLTSSAPWFSWENMELFKISNDDDFLMEAYLSGKDFYNFWTNNRDADNDGLCEWGGHAVLESVRDGQAAVWDQVGWPSGFECLDLNCMLVSEANSLAFMASELGEQQEYQYWITEAEGRKDSINKYMWDPQTGFYYNVDKTDNDFTYNIPDDLKRKEIIGFLPLWAGVADSQQAEMLAAHLDNPDEFYRTYGVPSLSADDPYYNDQGYWNGPVWVQWNYLVFRGLLRYGYIDKAGDLMERVLSNMINRLKSDHWFWELYSPDQNWAGWNKTYIWAGIAARMLIDYTNYTGIKDRDKGLIFPEEPELFQNYPNPFNPATNIVFQIPQRENVKVTVYDILGRRVETLLNDIVESGRHKIIFDADNISTGRGGLSSGVYFYSVEAGGKQLTKRMVFLK
ncbi:MAG TPA: trehalase family glycosidase [Ignavibacteriaceae bacterium]|nr:trehalase family glycosidase [Ignavibacteriaceae bacterium]